MAEPVLPADATLDQIEAFFINDRFAYHACAPTIEEARPGYARVSMTIEDHHLNGMNSLMGGVPYTLADFAFAIAVNVGGAPCVSVNCSFDYLGVPKDNHIVAECTVEKDGRSLVFARATVRDGLGRAIARGNSTGFRK